MADIQLKLSPSGASRWLNCPKAPSLEAFNPSEARTWSNEGTLGHALGEAMWNRALHRMTEDEFAAREKDLLDKLVEEGSDPKEIREAVYGWKSAVMAVNNQYATDWKLLEPEFSLPLNSLYPSMRGSIDLLGVFEGPDGRDALLVSDLKLGAGVAVRPHHNPQLMLYAYAAQFALLFRASIAPDTKVFIQIYQPRVDDAGGVWETSIGELNTWVDEVVKPAIDNAEKRRSAVPGKWCQFCTAAGVCKARAAYAEHVEEINAEMLTPEEIAEWLDRAPVIRGFLKALEDRARDDINRGQNIPGWGIRRTPGRRKINNDEEAIEALTQEGFLLSQVSTRKVVPLTALDDSSGRSGFRRFWGPT